ncbi:thiopeptide-type bacteriocin biosynthesis protein [Psychroserpens algicola]|uniref:Thiopeptide-type bacteriocin biosynthesis protein n=1 Tax=Psychroserpens algicola TaxID=1719034 RepID=A0ABT0HC46_9FLAO|nr:thiopeptide-type bacteriocin biosynthesis protein [Psychroserpens algicola]MCK8481923.1 thiopeptide-type bacteriocin biosynthesis protein [Psychroserpens algicola]
MNELKPQQSFIIGSEWLYYKIYSGVNTADIILADTIYQITTKLLESKLIDKWFFIRYNDPEFHIRLRLHVTSTTHIGTVISEVFKVFNPLINNKLIWCMNTDTYSRELDRYGNHTIEDIETFFFHDSNMMVKAIGNIKTDEERLIFVLKSVYTLLDAFHFDDSQKLTFVDSIKIAFRNEFNANKVTSKQLATKYRDLIKNINAFFYATHLNTELVSLDVLIEERHREADRVIHKILDHQDNDTLQLSLTNLLSSVIHMSVNRAFRSKQRQHEMVVYDFLSKILKTKIAKSNA